MVEQGRLVRVVEVYRIAFVRLETEEGKHEDKRYRVDLSFALDARQIISTECSVLGILSFHLSRRA